MTEENVKKSGYTKRWKVESFMSGLKRTVGSTLSARKPIAMMTEAALKVLTYALRRYPGEIYMVGCSTEHIGERGQINLELTGVDLTGNSQGDRILIAQILLPADAANPIGLPMLVEGDYVQPTVSEYFQVTHVSAEHNTASYETQLTGKFHPMIYDADDDGRVGLSDFAGFLSQYGRRVEQSEEAYLFDYNRDGRVSLADFALFVTNYGKRKSTRIIQQTSEFSAPNPIEAEPLMETEPMVTSSEVSHPLFESDHDPTVTLTQRQVLRLDVGHVPTSAAKPYLLGPDPFESQLVDAVMESIGFVSNLPTTTKEDLNWDDDSEFDWTEECLPRLPGHEDE